MHEPGRRMQLFDAALPYWHLLFKPSDRLLKQPPGVTRTPAVRLLSWVVSLHAGGPSKPRLVEPR